MEAQMKAVVVGGVAGGMSFAARARRLAEDAQIVVLERDPYVSYANCGLPYYLGGEIGDRDALLLHTPQSLAESLALDVRTGHEVLAIDPAARTLLVREHATGRDYQETYDALVLSTGAAPVIPPIPGADLPPVRVLRTVPDADVLRDLVDGGARRAVVVGAGFIGLESAEALRHRGLAVTLVELAGQVLPALDPEMARGIELELLRAGVEVRLGTSVTALQEAGSGAVAASLSDGSQVVADLVLLAAGVRPETSLAAAAGLALGARGALLVDEHLRSRTPSPAARPSCRWPARPAGRGARPLTTCSAAADGAHLSLARLSCASSAPWPPPPARARRRCARPGSRTTPCTCTRTTTPGTTPAHARCT
jgi:NADPH-dependent 2,4-dienoyl-CoA reductase/sulfur reductase-like enzyme